MVDEEFPKDTLPFEEEIKKYIDKYVLEEEKEKTIKATSWYFITCIKKYVDNITNMSHNK